jgi:transposase
MSRPVENWATHAGRRLGHLRVRIDPGRLDCLNETIGALTEQIDARTAAFEAVYTSLLPVPGFDRLTIEVIIAKTGADMTRFPTAADLASWTSVCPGSHESAGKRRNVSTTAGNQWLRRALIESAPSRRANQRQLLRCPVPPDHTASRTQQSSRRCRPLADRGWSGIC